MSVNVRLQRRGGTHNPFYHIVVADKRSPRDGKFIEKLGYYDPKKEPSVMVIKEDRAKYWYSKGAQLSTAVAAIFKKQNLQLSRKA